MVLTAFIIYIYQEFKCSYPGSEGWYYFMYLTIQFGNTEHKEGGYVGERGWKSERRQEQWRNLFWRMVGETLVNIWSKLLISVVKLLTIYN